MRLSIPFLPAFLLSPFARAALETWNGTSVYVAYPPIPPSPSVPSYPGHGTPLPIPPAIPGNEPTFDNVILFITDIFGHNSAAAQKLANQISVSGNYLVVMPDIFQGDPVPENGAFPSTWASRHGPTEVEPALDLIVAEIKRKYAPTSIGATGYCFGGRYVFRYLSSGRVRVGVVAHPSSATIDEIIGVQGPVQIASASTDAAFPQSIRVQAENAYANSSKIYEISVFSGVGHGFAVRAADPNNTQHVYALNKAAADAVSWFKQWLV